MIRTASLNSEELQIYKDRNENRLRHLYEPEPGIFIAESPNVINRALSGGYKPVSFLIEEDQIQKFTETVQPEIYGVPVYVASHEVLTEITGYEMARGMLCAMLRRREPIASSICNNKRRIVVLHDIENPTNVGAIGVTHLLEINGKPILG